MQNILRVHNLTVQVFNQSKPVSLVDDISFEIKKGSIFAVVGESGCGKTTLAFALTRLFSGAHNYSVQGKVYVNGEDILELSDEKIRTLRREQIRYVFQDPVQSFNPVKKIKKQVYDALNLNNKSDRTRKLRRIQDLLRKSGIENPDEVLESYPHQLSVGTLQRILIVMAIFPSPKILIADEPTSSVDATLRYRILDFLDEMRRTMGMSILLITHDLEIARRYAEDAAVMYAGRLVEIAPREKLFVQPLHPYTQLLMQYYFKTGDIDSTVTQSLSGSLPSPMYLPKGCTFQNRCYKVRDDCKIEEPPLTEIDNERLVRCPYWK